MSKESKDQNESIDHSKEEAHFILTKKIAEDGSVKVHLDVEGYSDDLIRLFASALTDKQEVGEIIAEASKLVLKKKISELAEAF